MSNNNAYSTKGFVNPDSGTRGVVAANNMTTPQNEGEIHTSDRMLLGSRLYGRRTEQDQNLLGQIYTAEKHVVLALPNKGNVHILPQDKLDALLAAAREEGWNEGARYVEKNMAAAARASEEHGYNQGFRDGGLPS